MVPLQVPSLAFWVCWKGTAPDSNAKHHSYACLLELQSGAFELNPETWFRFRVQLYLQIPFCGRIGHLVRENSDDKGHSEASPSGKLIFYFVKRWEKATRAKETMSRKVLRRSVSAFSVVISLVSRGTAITNQPQLSTNRWFVFIAHSLNTKIPKQKGDPPLLFNAKNQIRGNSKNMTRKHLSSNSSCFYQFRETVQSSAYIVFACVLVA